jgi:hypothetical protein
LEGSQYWQPWPDYFDQYLNCCMTAEIWVYQDAQHDPVNSACGYPIYPFEAADVEFWLNTPGPCTLTAEYAVVWDYGTIYWGFPFPYYPAPDWSSGAVQIALDEAGSFWTHVDIPALERPCYHVPFFARFWHLSTDDFTEGANPVRCGPDTTKYGFWLTSAYDGSGRTNYGYYYNDIIGGYYDLNDIKGGMYRLLASGNTRDQNECELESLWYYKADFGEWECTEPVEEHLEICVVDVDTTVDPPETTWGSWRLVTPVNYGYAPDGMPDFPQMEPNWCGPTALANCLWWCFAGGFPWYAISNWFGGWDPSIPPALIAELAACCNTGVTGTNVYDMQQCVLNLNDTYGFWLTETTIVMPTFDDIEYQVRLSQDVILLLGFWYYDEEMSEWYRLGGHYVTCAGVNWEFFLLSFSDPYLDGFCSGWTPGDSSGGVFLAHDHTFGCHFDAGNVSHDYYQIAMESPSPGGILWIPYYEWYDASFHGMNFAPEHMPFLAPTATPQYPVVTEIEFAVVICPGSPFVTDQLDSWNIGFVKTNYGGEGPGCVYWEYYPDYTDDLWEGTALLGQDGTNLAMGATAAGENITFFPYGGLVCDYEIRSDFYHSNPPDTMVDLLLERCYAKYYHNVPGHELPLDVEMFGIGIDPGGDWCFGMPCGDLIIQKFVIHNTGESIIEDLEWALFFDWDVNLPEVNTSFGGGDSLHNTGWAYDSTEEGKVVYMTLLPTTVGKIAPTFDVGDQNTYFYPHLPGGPYDELKAVMEQTYWDIPTVTPNHTDTFDYAYLMASEKFDLAPCNKILQEYIIWYDTQIPSTDYAAYRHKLYRLMTLAGYYRGDVNGDGYLNVSDHVYMQNYVLFYGEDKWKVPTPFADQGDVNCNGFCDITDIVQMTNYLFKWPGTELWPDSWPIDKNRFFGEEYQELFKRTSLFVDPQWSELGQ